MQALKVCIRPLVRVLIDSKLKVVAYCKGKVKKMTNYVIVMAIVASVCFVKAIPIPSNVEVDIADALEDPMKFVSDFVGLDFKKILSSKFIEDIQDEVKEADTDTVVHDNKEVLQDKEAAYPIITTYTVNQGKQGG